MADEQMIPLSVARSYAPKAYDYTELTDDVRKNINKLAEAIKTKGYVVDMTEAISVAILLTYDTLALENNDAIAELVMACGTEPTLKDRLGKMDDIDAEVTTQLARKVDLDGAGQIKWGNIDQEAREFMLGDKPMPVVGKDSVGKENIIDNSVDYYKVDFVLKSKNLFNPAEVIRETNVSTVAEGLTYSADYNSSGFIEVYPDEYYTVNDFNFIGFFDSAKEFIERTSTSGTTRQVQVPENAFYMVCSWNRNELGDKQQINKGQALLEYDKYKLGFKDELVEAIKLSEKNFIKNSIPWSSLKSDQLSTNLYDSSKITKGVVVSSSTDADNGIKPSVSYNTTDYIRVEPNETYALKAFNAVAYYDTNKLFISRESLLGKNVIDVPSNTYFVRLSWQPREVGGGQHINKGRELSEIDIPYIPRVKQKVKVLLEHGGLLFSTGAISRAIEKDYETKRKTGKFLNVVKGTSVKIESTIGKIVLYEYNQHYNYLEYTRLENNEEKYLTKETTFIKVVVEETVKEDDVSIYIEFESPFDVEKWAYNDNQPNVEFGNINFTYQTFANEGRDALEGSENQEQISYEKYFSAGLLKLPDNYDPNGDPVRLIIYCSGGNGYYQFNDSSFSTQYEEQFKYLKDEGYAIMSAFPWTTKYTDNNLRANFSTPTGVSAFVDAYKWVVDNFNVRKDGVYLLGKSAGGYMASTLSYNKGIPVLATAMLAPAIDTIDRPFGYGSDEKLALADDFGFEGEYEIILGQDENRLEKTPELKAIIEENAEKMIGYNGIWNGIVGTAFEDLVNATYEGDYTVISNSYRVSNVPQKIWVAEDDWQISTPACRAYIQSIKNGQSIGELRLLPDGTGGHNATDTAEDALKVDVVTNLGVTHQSVPLAYAEAVQFFRRFG